MRQTLSIQNMSLDLQTSYSSLHRQLKATHILLRGSSRRQQRLSLDSLPNELLIHIFSFLELKPYLISRGVCKKWQVLLPLADLHPIRWRMLDLYHRMLQAPEFVETRPWILENLRPFDRQAYIDGLLAQHSTAIPEEFRLWILEWPAKMAIFGIWPGLPMVRFPHRTVRMPSGVNWMAYDTPLLQALVYDKGSLDPKENLTPALLVWRTSEYTRWLLFDEEEPELFGRVLEIAFPDCPSFYPTKSELLNYDYDPFEIHDYDDWIVFLEDQWERCLLTTAKVPDTTITNQEVTAVDLPLSYTFGHLLPTNFPSPPWIDRHAPRFLQDIAEYTLD
ncbi:hypothetical protein D9613_003675 [Agrocybe pediades]|uniref:F-box domain-containing protein n=1 Tax=Agrocybe pediades TaxID=84607 RepID=A0A8H4VJF0_9AGAR|nr:hypothetical protein D9613_003675 [Agrocybe pediades]